jgi:phytoene desaturase
MTEKAIVIGSGFGGLAAALRLRALGYQVVVLESGDQPGGRARVFQREGFTFDAGPTVVTAPYLFDELFELFGKRREDYVEFLPVDPFYRCTFSDGGHFDYVGDEERLLSQIENINPADVDGYRKMADHARRIFDIGYTELADVPFGRATDMLRIVPDLARLSAYRSVYGLVSKYIRDPRLQQVFTFEPLLIGGNPLKAPGIYLLIHHLEKKWGVHYAKGGTGAIVRALVQLLEETGAELQMNAPVSRIETRGDRATGVVLEDGRMISADIVVSNADPTVVYSQMLNEKLLKQNSKKKVLKKRQSMSLFVGYFGTKKKYQDTRHHTIVLGPRYKGLLRDIFDKRELARDFSLYLHRPSASDPNMSPPGQDAFYVLSPVPNQLSGIDWQKESPQYFDAILAELERRELPGLRENIVTQFSVDPRYFERDLRSHQGAAFGLEPVMTQSAYFRYHNASPDVRGLYFVGASTHPGAGVPGVLCSAKVLEKVVPRAGTLLATRLPERALHQGAA